MFDWWSRKAIVSVSAVGAAAYVDAYTLDCWVKGKERDEFEPIPLAAQVMLTATTASTDVPAGMDDVANMTGDDPIELARQANERIVLQSQIP